MAWYIHNYNLERNITGGTQIPLKGLIVANAAIEYRSDPQVFSIEMLNAFNLMRFSVYESYKANNCFVPWTLLWYFNKLLPQPTDECIDLFKKGLLNIGGM